MEQAGFSRDRDLYIAAGLEYGSEGELYLFAIQTTCGSHNVYLRFCEALKERLGQLDGLTSAQVQGLGSLANFTCSGSARRRSLCCGGPIQHCSLMLAAQA